LAWCLLNLPSGNASEKNLSAFFIFNNIMLFAAFIFGALGEHRRLVQLAEEEGARPKQPGTVPNE
jgi:hypothetical protein